MRVLVRENSRFRDHQQLEYADQKRSPAFSKSRASKVFSVMNRPCWAASAYAEKLLPQPHDFTALGFLNVNPRFSRPV